MLSYLFWGLKQNFEIFTIWFVQDFVPILFSFSDQIQKVFLALTWHSVVLLYCSPRCLSEMEFEMQKWSSFLLAIRIFHSKTNALWGLLFALWELLFASKILYAGQIYDILVPNKNDTLDMRRRIEIKITQKTNLQSIDSLFNRSHCDCIQQFTLASFFVCTFRWWYYVKNRTNSDPVNAIVFDLLNIVHAVVFNRTPLTIAFTINYYYSIKMHHDVYLSAQMSHPQLWFPYSICIPSVHLSLSIHFGYVCVSCKYYGAYFHSEYMFTNSMTHTSIFYDFSAHMQWMNGSSRIQMHTQFTFTIRMH